jgi:hypothetical protein
VQGELVWHLEKLEVYHHMGYGVIDSAMLAE